MGRVAEYIARRILDEVRRCVVMTTGCYDVLHAGHIRHLERARALGTKLIVALNSDESVRKLKGPERPINPQGQRRAVLEALRCVDEVRLFDGADATDLIREVRPHVLACGFGYAPDKIVGRELVESWGGRAVVTCTGDARDEPSTTKIVRRARAAEVIEVIRSAMPYSVNPFEKLKLLAEQLLSVAGVPGDVADLGAYRGGASLVLRRLAPDRHLHLFDTWAGNPYDDPLCHHKRGEWVASLEECQRLVGNGEATHYHQGVFSEWGGDYPHDDNYRSIFCFVYVDMDTYLATKDAIEFFWPRLVPGGKIVVDDYGWGPCAGVKKAIDEAFTPEQLRVFQQQYTCVVEKK
jgi:D-beta-D-heptose 7-phosphate kinase/D-beta-D-heptose 1-phosphate adenosyltransferase